MSNQHIESDDCCDESEDKSCHIIHHYFLFILFVNTFFSFFLDNADDLTDMTTESDLFFLRSVLIIFCTYDLFKAKFSGFLDAFFEEMWCLDPSRE